MSKYINKLTLILIVIIFITLKLTDFNQTMTPYWVGPYLSAAVNFDWSHFVLYVNWDEIDKFSALGSGSNAMFTYNFTNHSDLMAYDYLAKGLVLLLMFAKKLFFWQGDLDALCSLQYIVHIGLSLYVLSLFKEKYQKILFFILYVINPLVLWVVNYPFYYFWQVIPSVIFIYWYLKKDIKMPLFLLFSAILGYIYITRPTVLFLIILFYMLFGFKKSLKKAFVGFVLFFGLINIAPSLSIGPWHTMYVGIGAYQNPYGIKLDDEEGYKYYKEQTGKIVNSGNIMNTEIKNDYYNVLKKRYFEIIKENPIMMVRNAIFNTIQAYSFGYSHRLHQKFGDKLIYISIIIGLIIIGLLLYTKQYILFLAIGFASGSFTLYFPPILTYMYGNFILLVIGFIGIVDYFIKKREFKNAN